MAPKKISPIALGASLLGLIALGAALSVVGTPAAMNSMADDLTDNATAAGPAPSPAMGVQETTEGNYSLKEHVWLHREVDMGDANGTKSARVTYADLYEAETGAYVGVKRDVSLGSGQARVVDIELPRHTRTGLQN